MRGIRAVCALSVVALAGCSSPAEPETLDPLPSTTAPPPSAPADSAAASHDINGEDEAAASLAVGALESYFTSANAVARGGDASEHESRYAAGCQACTDATDDFLTAQADGLAADGDRYAHWSISVENPSEDSSNQAVLTSVIDFAAINLIDTSGRVVESVPAWSGAVFAWTLNRQPDDSWLIVSGQELQ